jgi:two-component system, chemotaxis family, chemotaxis protein CheY
MPEQPPICIGCINGNLKETAMLHFAPRIEPFRALCVEEDVVQRKLLQACFDVVGAESLFAATASQALSLFRHNDVDIVLMDFDLHTADELAAFEAMQATPHWRVPILAVTDNECRWSEEAYREVGFAGLYVKPIEPSRLITAMDTVLRGIGQPPLLNDRITMTETGMSYLH